MASCCELVLQHMLVHRASSSCLPVAVSGGPHGIGPRLLDDAHYGPSATPSPTANVPSQSVAELFHRRQDILLQHLDWLEPQRIVVPAGEDGHQVEVWKDKNKLPASASRTIGRDRALTHTKCPQPPLITIFGGHPACMASSADTRLCGFFDPHCADNLLAVPAPA